MTFERTPEEIAKDNLANDLNRKLYFMSELVMERLFRYRETWSLAKEIKLEKMIDEQMIYAKGKLLNAIQRHQLRVIIDALAEQEQKGDWQQFKRRFHE